MPKYTEQMDHPVPCVDVIILNDRDEILLTKRAVEPHQGRWSIIGGRVEVADNNIEATAAREVKEEAGLEIQLTHLVDILADSAIADPRFFVVQVVYAAKIAGGSLQTSREANEFKWLPLDAALQEKLAFNHQQILQVYASKKIQGKLLTTQRRIFSEYFTRGFVYEQNIYPRFAANAIILNDQKEILLAQRHQRPFTGAWDFPGGHIYVDETIEENLKRELREELGVESEMGELFQVYSDKGHSPKFADVVAFYFTTIKSQNFIRNIEMQDFKYFPLSNLPAEIAYHNEGALADIREFIFGDK